MSERTLLALPDGALAADVRAMLGESSAEVVGWVSDAGALGTQVDELDPDVVVLHEDVGPAPVLDIAREVSYRFPHVGIVLVVRAETPESLRGAMEAGVRDVVATPLSVDRLTAAVQSAAAWSATVRARMRPSAEAARPAFRGRMIAVAGAKGGVGATTLATQLALDLVRRDRDRGLSVCLVDLDLQAGDVRAYLDLEHRRSVSDLLPVANELTTRHLEEGLFAHESGLRVLLPPPRGEDADDVTTDAARRILGGIRSRFDLTVVDVGSHLTLGGAVALELADDVLLAVTPDVVSIRAANRSIAMWRRLDIDTDAVRVVVNRADRRREVQPDFISRVVGASVAETTVPDGFEQLEAAVNTGAPERVQPPVRTAIAKLAAELSAGRRPGPPADEGAPTLEERVAAETGQVSVETAGLTGIIAVTVLLVWQAVLTGYTFVLGQHAAREGARVMAIAGGDAAQIASAAREDLPRAWRAGAQIDRDGDDVAVSLTVPALVPGLASGARITSTAGVVAEGGGSGGGGTP